jgi:SWI/SNF-related matrix-associated actin-dependent regulator of chromatin subfamily A member 5
MSLQAANLTEEDIDQIIQKGERATEELNNKMTEFTDNAMKFTLDGGFTAYDFKDPEEEQPHDPEALRALMGMLTYL